MAESAAGWLRQRLANTWFGEEERPARAAAKAIAAAMKRDAATGERVDLVTITKAGFRRYERADVEKLLQ